jgi:hypothetical protein
MITRKVILRTFSIMGLLICVSGCKKSPTDAAPDVNEPTIALVCDPTSAAKDAVVSASVLIKGNSKEIRVFGLDVTFDTRMFQFQEVRRGTLTSGWAEVAGNEVGPGNLRVGGFVGSGTPIRVSSEGTLTDIVFKVTGGDYGNGQQSQICIKQYTDDLSSFKPISACATFTLKK